MAAGRFFSFIWKVSLGVLMAAIAGAGLFWLSQSSVLAINEIVIDGNHVVTSEQIMEAAGPLLRGQSILRPPLDAVNAELTAKPYIESVDFERDFPNTIIIHVREYRPLVALRAEGGKSFVLAPDGRVLSEQAAGGPALPVMATAKPCAAEVGKVADCEEARTGARFLANIPVSFNYQFAEISIAGGDIRAKTSSGVNVHFGSLDEYGMKFEVLRQLLARASVAGVSMTIDVSVPQRPVTKDDRPPASTVTTASAEEGTAPAAGEEAGVGQAAAGEAGAGAADAVPTVAAPEESVPPDAGQPPAGQ
ncbi:MAG: FtsQ-type POTRA domain-containing protein [Actinobacteria bacterium]|nr:FtsQ-type POTRA domain-containing protein [Actinomycetota bacterium]